EGPDRRVDRAPARAREARDRALLLREFDPSGDRRCPGRDRVARLPAAYQGCSAPALPDAGGVLRDLSSAGAEVRGALLCAHGRRKELRMHPAADRIRNVALVGHRGAGKTSLHEALLFEAGVTSRLGTVPDRTTVSDSDPDEQARQMSISAT